MNRLFCLLLTKKGRLGLCECQGIPTVVTQAYLVAISVIMSWQLSRFEEVGHRYARLLL